jgi:hypothetical protein
MKSEMKTVAPSMQVSLASWALLLAGLINLAVGTFYAITANAALAVTGLSAGLILLFAATIDRFESIKGLGLEAKTRALDAKIDEADKIIAKLRNVAELTGASLIELNSKAGRWDSAPSTRAAYELSRQIKATLTELGSTDAVVRAVLTPWARVTAFDVALKCVRWIAKETRTSAEELRQKQAAIPLPWNADDPELAGLQSRLQRLGSFEAAHMKSLHDWPLNEVSVRLRRVVEEVPEISEAARQTLLLKILPWFPRLEFLASTLELQEAEVWFAFKSADDEP